MGPSKLRERIQSGCSKDLHIIGETKRRRPQAKGEGKFGGGGDGCAEKRKGRREADIPATDDKTI